MTPNAISGSTLSIGYRVAPKILVTESDFDGQDWTEVGGLTEASPSEAPK